MVENMKIVIYASSSTEYVEMEPLFKKLVALGHDVQLAILVNDPATFKDNYLWDSIKLLKKEKEFRIRVFDLVYYDEWNEEKLYLNRLVGTNSFIDRVNNWWEHSTLRKVYYDLGINSFTAKYINPIINFIIVFRAVQRNYFGSYNFQLGYLGREKFDVAVLPDNVVGPVWPPVTKACRELNTAIAIFPFTICNQEEAIQTLRNNTAFQTKNNTPFAPLFRKWRFKNHEIDIMRIPIFHVFMHYLLRVVPNDPWHYLSGVSDLIAVDCEANKEYFLKSGIEISDMKVTGSLFQDYIWGVKENKNEKRQAFISKNKLDPLKPIFLIGGCPDQFGSPTVDCEFRSMKEMAVALEDALRPLNGFFNIVIRPHPNFIDFGKLFKTGLFHVSEDPTYDLIPISECYVAFASATIRWAIFSSVPVIDYDVFGYDFSEYKGQPGVEIVSDIMAFKEVTKKIMESPSYLTNCETELKKVSGHWGVSGGLNFKRINEALCSLKN